MQSKLKIDNSWDFPPEWHKITTIDAHTAGEPLRIILSGFPDLVGKTILEKRRYAKQKWDFLRTALMWEPRGHADMYGCIILPPITESADFAVLFIHNEGFSTMCGHGIIAVTKVVLDTGMLKINSPTTVVNIDTPAGLVTAFAHIENQRVKTVSFQNVPSFVVALDEIVEVPGVGMLKYDLAFGGAYYAFVQVSDVNLTCSPKDFQLLIEKGMAIKKTIMQRRSIQHPFDQDLGYLYGTIFIGPPENKNNDSRNVCIFAEGEVDRSPTGTGVSARMAIDFARGEIEIEQSKIIESIIGSTFSGKVMAETTFGPYKAVIPEVEGKAFITAKNEFTIDPADPLKYGFLLR